MEVKYANFFLWLSYTSQGFHYFFSFSFLFFKCNFNFIHLREKITPETTFFYLRDCYLHTKERDWKYEFQGYNAFVSNWLVFL